MLNLRLAKRLAKGRHGIQRFTSCAIYISINIGSVLHMAYLCCSVKLNTEVVGLTLAQEV